MKVINYLLITLIMLSCGSSIEEPSQYIESPYIKIPNSVINQITKQDVYDRLYEIYQIRQEAIDEQIRSHSFSICKENMYKPLDSIKSQYNIKINLTEPTSPFISIDDKYIHWYGNLTSPISIIEIVNPECSLCQMVTQRINKVYETFKNEIKLGYVIYSYENSLSIQALLYASKHGKFVELFNNLMSLSNQPDTTALLDTMAEYGLDTIRFQKELPMLKQECLNKNIHIRELGISKTPTILVNKKLVYNPMDTVYIKKGLSQEK